MLKGDQEAILRNAPIIHIVPEERALVRPMALRPTLLKSLAKVDSIT